MTNIRRMPREDTRVVVENSGNGEICQKSKYIKVSTRNNRVTMYVMGIDVIDEDEVKEVLAKEMSLDEQSLTFWAMLGILC